MKKPAPGVIVGVKYRLERPLASGGMGSVWVARHLQLEVDVAIKFMGHEAAVSADGHHRFEREAKAAALLHSPYVVSVQDYGVDDDLPYMVMELLEGEDLEARLRRSGRLSPDEAMLVLAQTAKGLGRAHELGIVHRDLKPRNLFLASSHDEEIVKILDFGIAKQVQSFGVIGATTSHHLVGSPNYMSPEQVRGAKDIDHRSDLWSLGVIMYQALTGVLPFEGDVLIDVLNKVASGPIPPPTELVPDLPAGVDTFFQRALARDRAGRYQSAREMVDSFAELVLGAPAASRPSIGLQPPIADRGSDAPVDSSRTSRRSSAPGRLVVGNGPRKHSPMAETLAADAPISDSPPATPSPSMKMVPALEVGSEGRAGRSPLVSFKNVIVVAFILIAAAAGVMNLSSGSRRSASQGADGEPSSAAAASGAPSLVAEPRPPSSLVVSPAAQPSGAPSAAPLEPAGIAQPSPQTSPQPSPQTSPQPSPQPSPSSSSIQPSASAKPGAGPRPTSSAPQKRPANAPDEDPEKWGF